MVVAGWLAGWLALTHARILDRMDLCGVRPHDNDVYREEKERLEEERRLRDLELAESPHLAQLFQRRNGGCWGWRVE